MKPVLSQIVVYVSDMSRSIAFYRDLLGLRLVSESNEWSEFEVSPAHLALHWSSVHEEVPGEVTIPAGRAELIFEVDDLDASCAEIRQKGGAVDGPKELEGIEVRVAFLRDPDGMSVELMERK